MSGLLRHPPAWYRDAGGRAVDARRHLLDRQLVDPDGVPVSTVDDLELDGLEEGAPIDASRPVRVEALLVGSTLLTRTFGGRMPRRRWERIAWHDVDRIATVIRLRVHADDLDVTWLERWFRDRIVARIPGGRDAPG